MIVLKFAIAAYLAVSFAIALAMFLDVTRHYGRPLPLYGTSRVLLRCAYLALFWLPDFVLFCWTDRDG